MNRNNYTPQTMPEAGAGVQAATGSGVLYGIIATTSASITDTIEIYDGTADDDPLLLKLNIHQDTPLIIIMRPDYGMFFSDGLYLVPNDANVNLLFLN